MELAEGFTLRQIINQYRVLPLDFAVTVTTQVCSALDEAHGLGIVHRDIKPENIVANQTTTGWYIKVLDFGIAKLYNQGDIGLTQDGSAMGTPQYMSPEQCMGESLDPRSDIYSVGIMLYEMLTGTVPFKSPTASAIAVHQVQTAPQPLRTINEDIHPAVEAVVLKSLEKQREPRQQKASQLAQELIQAATVAFKSGFTAVPAAPIPKPDVIPEFGQSDEDSSNSTTAPESIEVNQVSETPEVVADETQPIAETKTEVEKKGKRPRSKKNIEIVAEEMPAHPSIELPTTLHPVLVSNEPFVEVDKVEFENHYAETLAVEIAPREAANVATAGDLSEESVLTATENSRTDDIDLDLSGFFDAAEHRLDEILPDERPSPVDDAGSVSVESDANEETPVNTIESESEIGLPDETNKAETVSTFGNIDETRVGNNKLLIMVAAGVIIFLIGIIGLWYLFSGSGREIQATNRTSLPLTDSTTIPVGMALVPGGEFLMGSDSGDEQSRPAHNVTVKPFYMDITEVTNEAYKKFIDATKHSPPASWINGTFPDGKSKFPVTGVNWDDANEYAKWAGKRLPSEEEWEFAARGTDGRIYPWGKDWKSESANADNQAKAVREVGQGDGKSPFGMFDMVGNAWEWTASDFVAYAGGKLSGQTASNLRVIRGGCFLSKPNQATTVIRVGWPARGGNEYDNTGFRCAKDSVNPQ
jgi:formylglycine-generating enzyme required for sulfatase activity